MRIAPIIFWCETQKDLKDIEKYTDIYFTEEESDFTNFPCVYFADYNPIHYVSNDIKELPRYDMYEYSLRSYSSIEQFKKEKYYNVIKEGRLIPIDKPSDIEKIFPEYII